MKSANNKIRLIFYPFLIIGVCFISIYSVMKWFLFIHSELLSINKEVLDFGIPFCLISIGLWIWLRPRIHLLALEWKGRGYFLGAAVLIIALTNFFVQEFLTIHSGKLTQLDSISAIHKQEKSKFYAVKNYYVSKKNMSTFLDVQVEGRYSDRLALNLFITLPIYDSLAAVGTPPPAWIGVKYSKELKSFLSEEEKERDYNAFLESTQKDFKLKNVQDFVYLDRIGNSNALNNYKKALKKNAKFTTTDPIILLPVNTPYDKRTDKTLKALLSVFLIGTLIWFISLDCAKFDEAALARFLEERHIEEDNVLRDYLKMVVIPREGFFVTPILINITVGISLLMCFLGYGFMSIQSDDLLQWGANYRPAVLNGEFWRLLSSTFLHSGFYHLIPNMFVLWLAGMYLEPFLGRVKYILAFLLSGAIASLSSIYWYEATVSVGASGAVFGLCGIFISLALTKKTSLKLGSDINCPILGIIMGIVGCGLVSAFLTNGLDHAAHIGGVLSGLALGVMIAQFSSKTALGFSPLE